ncbi:F-box protein At5g07610-like [Triticum dicoccoides]|uniref:F-box protein At5g07610-like n=1 Tax=Triticum dicoccoides TaxID=85692 RepID=UPI001891A956|nr:F-box protein At5g07610-like [Triticum dicoccoides]
MSVPADGSRPPEDGRASVCARPSSAFPSGTAAGDTLTDDVLIEILSRVPAKSLCRFKCVSSHWLALIDHPDHRNKLPQTLAGFFYTSSKSSVEQLFLELPFRFAGVSGKRCPPVDTSFSFLPSHRRVDLLDCCNGLLLCRWYGVSSLGDEFCYIVCNPATKEWVSLPDRSHENKVGIERLGFDPTMSSHFYVFVLLENVNFNAYLSEVEVYSSETKRWVYKEIGWNKRIVLPAEQSSAVFLNGCLHFYSFGKSTHRTVCIMPSSREVMVMWFD